MGVLDDYYYQLAQKNNVSSTYNDAGVGTKSIANLIASQTPIYRGGTSLIGDGTVEGSPSSGSAEADTESLYGGFDGFDTSNADTVDSQDYLNANGGQYNTNYVPTNQAESMANLVAGRELTGSDRDNIGTYAQSVGEIPNYNAPGSPVNTVASAITSPSRPKVTDHSAEYNAMYDNAYNSQLATLKQAIARSISDQNELIAKAPQTVRGQEDTASFNGAKKMQALREMLANGGQAGGVNRTEETQVKSETENEINALEMQKNNVINDAYKKIADLTAQGETDKAKLLYDVTQQKISALIAEQNRVESTEYQHSQDDRNFEIAKAGLTGKFGDGTKTLAGVQAEEQNNQVNIDNAWKKVNSLGYVDAESAMILGVPEGTTSLDAQNQSFNQKITMAGVTGTIDGGYTLAGKEFNWNTDVKNNPALASTAEQLKEMKAQFTEWNQTAPLRIKALQEQVLGATDANRIAVVQKAIADEELKLSKVNVKYADETAKQAIATAKAQIENAKGQLAVAQKNATTSATKATNSGTKSTTMTPKQIGDAKKAIATQLYIELQNPPTTAQIDQRFNDMYGDQGVDPNNPYDIH